MRGLSAALGGLLALMPCVALAATPAVLDLTSGAPADLLSVTRGIALSACIFVAIIGVAIEGLGRSPFSARDVGSVAWRLAVVALLLWNYAWVFGSFIALMEGIGGRIAPPAAFDQFSQEAQSVFSAHLNGTDPNAAAASAGSFLSSTKAVLGDFVFAGFMNTIILLGELAFWLMGTLGHILIALMYVLGPLALVASIPRGSTGVGLGWFKSLATYCVWPIVLAVLLRLVLAIGLHGLKLDGTAALSALSTALLLLCTALAVPALASGLVGSAASNFVAQGKRIAQGLSQHWIGQLLKLGEALDGKPAGGRKPDAGADRVTRAPGPAGGS